MKQVCSVFILTNLFHQWQDPNTDVAVEQPRSVKRRRVIVIEETEQTIPECNPTHPTTNVMSSFCSGFASVPFPCPQHSERWAENDSSEMIKVTHQAPSGDEHPNACPGLNHKLVLVMNTEKCSITSYSPS